MAWDMDEALHLVALVGKVACTQILEISAISIPLLDPLIASESVIVAPRLSRVAHQTVIWFC